MCKNRADNLAMAHVMNSSRSLDLVKAENKPIKEATYRLEETVEKLNGSVASTMTTHVRYVHAQGGQYGCGSCEKKHFTRTDQVTYMC